jgi:hypothetical protein
MKVSYIAGIIVLDLVIIGSYYGQKAIASSSAVTWGPVQSAKVDQIWVHSSGHIGYGINETSGAVSEITAIQSCELHLGDTVLYQDSNKGERRIVSPANCQTIQSGEL